MKKINKFITYIVIPLLLIGFWAISTVQYSLSQSFSVLEYSHSKSGIISGPSGKVLKGDKITGEFKAKEDNLGILVIKFRDFTKFSYEGEDILSFKLKEKGENNWKFKGSFRSSSLEKNLNYPIGFPVIPDSKGKEYFFEIQSLNGNEENGVVFDKNNSAIYTRYQFPTALIKSNNQETIKFLIKKADASVRNPKFVLNSLLYLIPLLIYLFLIYAKRFNNARKIFISTVLLLILMDIFYLQEIQIAVTVGLLLGWIFVIKQFDVTYRFNFSIALSGIIIWAIIAAPLNINHIEDKLNLWTYIFLLIGLIQIIIEEKRFKK